MSLAITQEQTDWTPEQRRVLPSVVNGKASEAELQLLLHTCQRTGLDVFSKQIYAISRGGKLSVQTSIDGFRTVASRAAAKRGLIIGNKPVVYYNRAGNALPFAPDDLFALTYTVTITAANGALSEMSATLKLAEYQQNSPFWKKMAGVMLAKCAEAVALRSAFPSDLGGIYTTDEYTAGDNKSDMTSARKAPPAKPANVSDATEQHDPFAVDTAPPEGHKTVTQAKMAVYELFTSAGLDTETARACAKQVWVSVIGDDEPATVSPEVMTSLTEASNASLTADEEV